jgi:hypothetical protein
MMKQHKINDAWNFIGGWYIDEDICDRMVSDFEARRAHHFQAHSARGYTYLPSSDMDVDLITDYEQVLSGVVNQYKALYKYSTESLASWSLSFPYNIQKYEPGKHYSVWHCENNGNPQYFRRHLAFMTYLNDVTDGGETEFLYQNTWIKPEKGLTLVWPAHFTHIHRGIPSPTQEKYVTTGWYEFFDTESFLDQQISATDADFWENLDKMTRNIN